ncbi:DUF4347 domain-containing protein, partial [Microcoleus sp. D3_18a_C4]|uniref:DUF4347 domain-containing protein n=1 Tax=Microcoleus sp. D3_18a_C4 TaxID=3055332 RepID=UPI002FD3E75D
MNLPTANKQIIFVDSSVQDYQSLIQNIDAAQIFILNENLSGIEQITNVLANQKDIEAVHILSHGSEGSLKLGADVLKGNDIENFSSQLKQWGNALTENGDLLLYGCDAGAGEAGQNFVKRLSEITGGDVAASNNLTGNAVKGGDWDLEIVTGQIEAAVPLNPDAMADYEYTLANFDVTVATDDGTGTVAGTLSKAILDANALAGDDTITLTTNVTVTGVMLTLVNSNIDFIGNNFSVDGGNAFRPFFVKSGTVNFQNLTITNGRAKGGDTGNAGGGAGMGGGLFIYNGTVSVSNVTFSNNRAQGSGNIGGLYGGGGMFGNGGGAFGGGGGLFGNGGNNGGSGGIGGYGGSGAYGGFGGNSGGGAGGFGGGGGGGVGSLGGAGGFGGGGGGGLGGLGGFGGGGGYNGNGGYGGGGGTPGFGGAAGNGGGGAGMGGAIFIRQGSLTLNNATFSSNTATGGTGGNPGQGKGGAIFAMQSLTNTNSNNQGMPTALPTVTTLGATFTTNTAANQAGTPGANTPANGVGNSQDNNDVYGTIILGNTVNLSVSSNAGTEAGTTLITVTATASQAVVGNQTVNLGVTGTNITAGDYNLSGTTITIPNGQTTGTVTFTVADDALIEGSETATLAISNPSAGIFLGTTTTQNIAITDNDFPAVNLSVTPTTGTETGTTAITVTATASQAVTGAQTVDVALSGTALAADFTGTIPTSITIANGQTTGSFTVNIIDDALIEGTETGTFTISNPSAGLTLGTTTIGNVTITDNDFPAVNLSVTPSTGTETGTTAITVTATASQAVVGAQTVDVALSGTALAADFTGTIPTSITIPSGQTTGSFTVNINDDALIEGSETGTFTISNPSAGLTLGTTTTGNATITDNDFPAVNLSVTPTTGTETGTTAITVTATASQAVVGNQTVDVALSGTALPADFTGTIPTSITIPSGQTTGSFTVNIDDDALIEGTETGTFTISNPSAGLTLGTTTIGNVTITDNDFPAVNLSVTPSIGTEAGTTAITVTATASQAVVGNQTVNLGVTGTNITAGDYNLSGTTITIPSGQTTGTVTFTVADDVLIEGNETATLAISNPSAGIVLGTNTTQNIAITDNDFPTVNLSVTPSIGTEAGTTSITIIATAAAPVVGNQTVDLALTGVATAADFTGTIPTQITIANGTNSGQVTFTITDDQIDEIDETANLTISNPSAGIVLGSTTTGSFTITDNDIAGFDILPISGNTSETGAQATFDIRLRSQPTANVTIGLTSNNSAEGTVLPANLTFNSTNWNAYQTVSITGVNDLVADGNINYQIITAPDTTTADTNYNNLNPADVALTNTDNDTPGVTVTQSAGSTEVTEGGSTDTYTLQLNTLPTSNVQITVTADAQARVSLDGTNFAASQTLTFTNVNGITPQTVTVRAVDDTVPENNHIGALTHAITNSADPNYPTTLAIGPVNAQITDNDITYSVVGSSVTVTEGNSGTQVVSFTVTRTGEINQSSSIDFSFAGGATAGVDYNNPIVTGTGVTATGSTISFAANATTATIAVAVVGDRIVEPNETASLTLSNATAPGTANIIGSGVTTTIQNDDTAGISINPTAGLTTTEAGGTANFTVVLNSQPTADVSIGITSDKTAEGTVDKPSLTFTSANWNVPQTVTVTGVDDLVVDGNAAYNIVTAAATSTDTNYSGVNADDVAVTNTDNDTKGITVTPTSGLTTTEAGGTANFTVVLNSQPTADVSIG